MKIETDYEEGLEVHGRACRDGGAHIAVFKDGDPTDRLALLSLSVPQVKQLRKALKKAAGL